MYTMDGRNKRKYIFWDTPLPKINVEWDGRQSRAGKTKHVWSTNSSQHWSWGWGGGMGRLSPRQQKIESLDEQGILNIDMGGEGVEWDGCCRSRAGKTKTIFVERTFSTLMCRWRGRLGPLSSEPRTQKIKVFDEHMFNIGVGVNGVEWDGCRQSRAGKQINIRKHILNIALGVKGYAAGRGHNLETLWRYKWVFRLFLPSMDPFLDLPFEVDFAFWACCQCTFCVCPRSRWGSGGRDLNNVCWNGRY